MERTGDRPFYQNYNQSWKTSFILMYHTRSIFLIVLVLAIGFGVAVLSMPIIRLKKQRILIKAKIFH